MSLFVALSKLADELDVHSSLFEAFVAAHPIINSASALDVRDECLLEGHVSRVWQAWCHFWRTCVLDSCLGTVDGNGVVVVAHSSASAPDVVSSASIRAKKGSRPFWQGSNSILRLEPTWGDTDSLATIVSRLAPANETQLLAAISSAHGSAKRLQSIRNCSAHLNFQTLAEVRACQTSYLSFPISHPVQSLFWVDPTSNDYLFVKVVEELKDAALAAIS